MEDLSLEGKTAVVTGGSRGIGRAIALAFARAGADVVIAARGKEALEEAAGEIEALGRKALPVITDVANPDDIQNLMDRAVETFGGFDILVNNAGAAPFSATVDSMRPEGFEKYFRINFISAWYATRAAAPVLLGRGAGSSVLNVASVGAYIATPGITYYGTAKAALVSLTRSVALEWAASGVRVNALAPGWIDTEMNAFLRSSPDIERGILSQIPMGRWGRSDEVAAAAVFLCSPAASFITGAVLVVDGGQTVTSRYGP